jgi:hypothetical protein
MSDSKIRKFHTRKINHAREKTRDRIFNYFQKGSQPSFSFYEDILHYIEYYMKLDYSYRGLNFVDLDDSSLKNDQEKIEKMLNLSHVFYFLLKLSSTFYLVKAYSNPSLEISFTFLCDYTTLSTGNQLVFPHVIPVTKGRESKTKLTLPKIAEEFRAVVG